MTARPLDATGQSLRLLVLLRRYENTLAGQAGGILAAARDALVQILERQDLTVVSAGRVQARLASIAGKADDVLLAAYQQLNADIRDSLLTVASAQTQAVRRMIAGRAPAGVLELGQLLLPTRSQLRAIVTSEPVRGAVAWDWWKRQRLQTRHNVMTQLRIGLTGGESIDDLVRRIRGRALGQGRYEGGVMPRAAQQAGALVRTIANQVGNRASQLTYQANSDLVEEYEYVATLDTRTTPICRALDGKIFRVDDAPAPRPPQHWGCRSTTIPHLDHAALGIKPPKEPRETYDQWLRRQDPATQNDVLGPARAQLYRDGKIGLEDLVRRDGTQVRLEDLVRSLADAQGGPPPIVVPPAGGAVLPRLPVYLDGATAEALRAAESESDAIAARSVEYARAYDAAGRQILGTRGTENRVRFTQPQIAQLAGANLLTHNHPNGSSFSPDDAIFAQGHAIQEMQAVAAWPTGERVTYRLRVPPSAFIPYGVLYDQEWARLRPVYVREVMAAINDWRVGRTPAAVRAELRALALPEINPGHRRDLAKVAEAIQDLLFREKTHLIWEAIVRRYPGVQYDRHLEFTRDLP